MSVQNNIQELNIPNNVILLAATKGRSIEQIKEVIEAGVTIIGENYVQEAEGKFKELKGKVKFHFIGHLQTNKVKKAVEIFDMIQTIDSEKISVEVDKRCREINKRMPVLIEVNIGEEENKTGCMPDDVKELAEKIKNMKNLELKGIMTMAPYFEDAEKTRPYFKKTFKVFEEIRTKEVNILSMGMSDSYNIAIEEGANMVRIGTVIFGNIY